MDLPKLLVNAAPEESGSLIDQATKLVKFQKKELEKQRWNVFLILDPEQGKIRFDLEAWNDGAEQRYRYLGNNQAAAGQVYAVREVGSFVNFWTGRPRGILQNILEFLKEGELYDTLQQCRDAGLFNDSGLCIEKMPQWNQDVTVDRGKKKFCQGEESVNGNSLLSDLLELSKSDQVVLIIPCIQWQGERMVLSQHPDYLERIEDSLQGSGKKAKNQKIPYCHICGQCAAPVDTKGYSAKLSKSSVGKVFVTTQINYASMLNKKAHQENFSICESCYQKWFVGERMVMGGNHLKVAGEDAVVLFEGITERMDRSEVERLKAQIDFAFVDEKVNEWAKNLQDDLDIQGIALYEFHILFYRTDGKSCAIKKSIEDVSAIRFLNVLETFEQVRSDNGLRSFKPVKLYRLLPVRTNKSGDQLNIARLLDLYAAILKGYPVSLSAVFEWYAEAMERGNSQIRSGKLQNEKNLLNLRFAVEQQGQKTAWGREYYFRELTSHYQALIEVLRLLNLLENEVFDLEERENLEREALHPLLEKKEHFLDQHHFAEGARGIYYLGALMYQIGEMQRIQGHDAKPILEKVSYGGMGKRELMQLHGELMEKVRQYRKAIQRQKPYLLQYAELFAGMAAGYLGDLPNRTDLQDEHANVFYLMSGYTGCGYTGPNKKKNDNDGSEEEQEHAEDQP